MSSCSRTCEADTDSEGKWRPIRDDGPDGADLLKWIAEQPWSNGKVGTVGTSYSGATQHAIGITNAPSLAAMVPVDAMSNAGQFGVRHNGAFELRWLNWIFTLGNATGTRASATGLAPTPNGALAAARAASAPDAVAALQEMGTRVQEYAKALPLRPGTTPLKFAPDYEAWLIEAMGHGDNDAYWANMGSSVVDHIAEYQDVPSYHVTGWYDSWGAQVANLNYVQLSKAKKSLQRLIVGPVDARRPGPELLGHRRIRPAAAVDMNAFRHRWFDRWLLGLQNGVDREPPVRLFVMGGGDAHKTPEGRLFVGGAWREEREWPLARTVYTPVLPARGRNAVARASERAVHADPVFVRSAQPGSDDRRQRLVRRRADAEGRAGPALLSGALVVQGHAATVRAPGRRGLPDAAASGRMSR